VGCATEGCGSAGAHYGVEIDFLGQCFPRSQMRDLGHPAYEVGRDEEKKRVPIRLRSGPAFDSAGVRFAQDERGRLRFEVSHPSDKNKDVARMGRPASAIPRSPSARDRGHPHLLRSMRAGRCGYRVLSVTGSGWMVTRWTSGHSSLKRSSSAVMTRWT
jgi:hypothetical protein